MVRWSEFVITQRKKTNNHKWKQTTTWWSLWPFHYLFMELVTWSEQWQTDTEPGRGRVGGYGQFQLPGWHGQGSLGEETHTRPFTDDFLFPTKDTFKTSILYSAHREVPIHIKGDLSKWISSISSTRPLAYLNGSLNLFPDIHFGPCPVEEPLVEWFAAQWYQCGRAGESIGMDVDEKTALGPEDFWFMWWLFTSLFNFSCMKNKTKDASRAPGFQI